MSWRTTLRLPREHGAWAMLLVPFVLGVLVAGKFTVSALLVLLSALAMFISRESLLAWRRARRRNRDSGNAGRMLALYLALAALLGAPLIFYFQLYLLLPLALAGVALLIFNGEQGAQMEERSITNEALAISAMTLTAPAAYYTARGVWDSTALWLWALSALFFVSSVYYVRLRVLSLNERRQAAQRRVWQRCVFYHGFLLAGLLALALTGRLSLFALIAFTPILIRTFIELLRPSRRVNFKLTGMLELAWSVIFLIFITLTFRHF